MKNISRKEALEMRKLGWALIDTSGRTRVLREKSTIALASKEIHFTVKFRAKDKQEIFKKYVKKVGQEELSVRIHCIGLFYCLRDYINNLPGVFICADGQGIGRIKHYLQTYLGSKYDDSKILIHSSLKKLHGKKNMADRLAYNVNKKIENHKPTMFLTLKTYEKFHQEK